jgi:hypothetical protein
MAPSASKGPGRERQPFLHDLYPGLTSFPSLLAAAKAAQRGKRYRPDVLAFNSRLEAEIFQLQQELRGFTYQPGAYRRFAIRDPKPRLIAASPPCACDCTRSKVRFAAATMAPVLSVFSCGLIGCGCATTTCSRGGDASNDRRWRWRPAAAPPTRPVNHS